MTPSSKAPSAMTKSRSWINRILFLQVVLGTAGCGEPAPRPLSVDTERVTSLDLNAPFLLPANTKLEAINQCVVSFPGADLFEPGDVVGEVVVIDDDALIYMAPNNETIAVTLQRGHSMLITKARTITVDESETAPCRFRVTRPDGT